MYFVKKYFNTEVYVECIVTFTFKFLKIRPKDVLINNSVNSELILFAIAVKVYTSYLFSLNQNCSNKFNNAVPSVVFSPNFSVNNCNK